MWVRGIAGCVLVCVGAVWIAQGVDVLKGSPMTGHVGYAYLGAAVVVVGLVLLWTALRRRTT